MPHHVRVTVPAEHAPAVHEALVSIYASLAGAVAEAAGRRDPNRLREARAELHDAEISAGGYGWEPGPRLGPAELEGRGLFVHLVLGAAVEDALGTLQERFEAYGAGETALEAVEEANAALAAMLGLFAELERAETV